LQERREKISQALLVIRSRVNLSLWRKFVDDLWQVFGQKMRGLGGIDAKLCSESIDLVGTKDFLNLAARNRLVFSHADPGGKCVPLAALREFVRQTLQSSALCEEATKNPDELTRAARRISFSGHCTEYRVE
jgi:hypothetical protein